MLSVVVEWACLQFTSLKTSSPPQKSDPPSTAQLIIGSRDGNLRDILHSTNLWWKRQNLLANSGCLYPCSWATMVEAMPEHLANFSMFSIFRASSKMHMIQKNLKHVFMYGKKKNMAKPAWHQDFVDQGRWASICNHSNWGTQQPYYPLEV